MLKAGNSRTGKMNKDKFRILKEVSRAIIRIGNLGIMFSQIVLFTLLIGTMSKYVTGWRYHVVAFIISMGSMALVLLYTKNKFIEANIITKEQGDDWFGTT